MVDDGTDAFDPPINTAAPADDPGFYRVPLNQSAVYLGNQWVISARHAGVPGRIELDSGSYEVVPGSGVELSNPAFNDTIVFAPNGASITSIADIRLYRIRPNSETGLTPEQADMNLANDPFGTETVRIAGASPAVGTEVTLVASGRTRGATPGDNIPDDSVNEDGVATIMNSRGTFFGIPNQGPRARTFGRNRIARDSLVEPGSDSDNVFGGRINGRDIIASAIQFSASSINISGDDAAVPFEAQVADQDSGGGVFFREGFINELGQPDTRFVLGGLVHAFQNTGAPGRLAQFGGRGILSDLSRYADQINALLANDTDLFRQITGRDLGVLGYGINGDINLDGVVSGDGSGDPNTDDVAAFISGFGNVHLGQDGALLENGSLESWRGGDLNLDGATDLADFVLLRGAFNGTLNSAQLAALLADNSDPRAGTVIPEPGSVALAWFAIAASLRPLRRRSARSAA